MPKKKEKIKAITIPVGVFDSAESKEDIEDWLLAHNDKFIQRMRKARKDDLEGKCITLEELAKELNIKS
jgi:hypothetical protein